MKHHIALAALATALALTSPAFAGPTMAAPTSAPASRQTPTPAPTSRQAAVAHRETSTQRQGVERLYRTAQLKLKDMHLYNGAVDGRRNTAFVASLERFQHSHNIRANGRLNSETRAALGI